MNAPKKVLIVTNSTTDTEIAEINNALIQAKYKELHIQLNLVHVIPMLPACYFNIPSMVLLAEKYYEEAKHTLTHIGNTLNVAQKDQWLMTGKMRTEILRLANKLNSNFILASGTIIQDLHKTFIFNRKASNVLIKNMHHLTYIL